MVYQPVEVRQEARVEERIKQIPVESVRTEDEQAAG